MRSTPLSFLSLAVRFGVVAVAVAAKSSLAFGSCGKIEVSKGQVTIEDGKTKVASAAVVGGKICEGDTITAAADSRAKLKMEDGNELNISPDSKIVLQTYVYKPDDNKKKVLLNVLKGKIRATTKEENMYNDKAKDGQANTFQVQTRSAIAGVRGTDFLTSYDPGTSKSEVITFRGKVEVGQPGPNGSILNSVSVVAGQSTQVLQGATPQQPKVIPASDLKKVNVDSSADNSVPSAKMPIAGSKSDGSTVSSSVRAPSSLNTAPPPPPLPTMNSGSLMGPKVVVPPALPVVQTLPPLPQQVQPSTLLNSGVDKVHVNLQIKN